MLTLSVFSYIDAQTAGKRVPTTLLVSGGVDAKLCVFSRRDEERTGETGETESGWIHAATYRSHTHDILCSTVQLTANNASTLFLTTKLKTLKHQLDVLQRNAQAAAHPSRGTAGTVLPAGSSEPIAASWELPVLRPVNEDLSMLAIVSGGADGNLVVYNLQGRLESLTFRLYGFPSFFCPAVAAQAKHCLLRVGEGAVCQRSSTTAWSSSVSASPIAPSALLDLQDLQDLQRLRVRRVRRKKQRRRRRCRLPCPWFRGFRAWRGSTWREGGTRIESRSSRTRPRTPACSSSATWLRSSSSASARPISPYSALPALHSRSSRSLSPPRSATSPPFPCSSSRCGRSASSPSARRAAAGSIPSTASAFFRANSPPRPSRRSPP